MNRVVIGMTMMMTTLILRAHVMQAISSNVGKVKLLLLMDVDADVSRMIGHQQYDGGKYGMEYKPRTR
jgi:hypothetical protein